MSAPRGPVVGLADENSELRRVLWVLIERAGGAVVIHAADRARDRPRTNMVSELMPDGSMCLFLRTEPEPEPPSPLEQAADALRAANLEMDGTEHPAIHNIRLAIYGLIEHARSQPVPAATSEERK